VIRNGNIYKLYAHARAGSSPSGELRLSGDLCVAREPGRRSWGIPGPLASVLREVANPRSPALVRNPNQPDA